jgi:hypothetical protein
VRQHLTHGTQGSASPALPSKEIPRMWPYIVAALIVLAWVENWLYWRQLRHD